MDGQNGWNGKNDDGLMYKHQNRHYHGQLFTSPDSSSSKDPLLANDHLSGYYVNHYESGNIDNPNYKHKSNLHVDDRVYNVKVDVDGAAVAAVAVSVGKHGFSNLTVETSTVCKGNLSRQPVNGKIFIQLSTVNNCNNNNSNKCNNRLNSESTKSPNDNQLNKCKINCNFICHSNNNNFCSRQNCCCCCPYQQTSPVVDLDRTLHYCQMAPNRRSIPTSLSLSDSSDPETWGSSPITSIKVKTTLESNGLEKSETQGSKVSDCKGLHYSQLNNSNYVNKINVNTNGVHNVGKDKMNNCVNVSSCSPSTSVKNHNHLHHNNHHVNKNNTSHHPCRNWPKIDLISSIDPFESTDSMISAFACVAHVINSDSANEEDQMDGDNEIIGIDDDDSETEQVNEDDDGSYDSSNHPNSLESPENYHPIHKPQLLGFTNKTCIPSNGNSNNNRKFNGNCSSNDRFSNKSGQVNVIKPLPPPLSTIPRPTQQPPPPPTSTSLSSTASTLVPKIQQNSSKPNVPVSVTKPITAKDHLYETIYPSNIRLTRDSRYFVDYQNYNSILSQPVDLISPLDSSKRISNGNGNSADSNNDLSDISQNSSTNSPINSKVNMVRRPTYTSSFAGNSNYKNGRLSTSSTSSSLNQKQKNYHQVQRSTLQPYNHQNHLPGLNSSSLCKPSLSSSSSLLSPPLYTSPSETNQGNQRLLKKSDSIHQNHLASSNSSSTPINRPTFLPFNKPVSFPSESYDQVDNKINNKPSSIINEINVNGNSSATLPNENDKNASNQVTAKNAKASDLKPDQVYPNPITMPIISRANVRSTEEYATVNKTRSIKSLKSATLTPSTPISYNDEIKLLSKDDSILNTKSKANESNGSPMSLSSSTSSPLVSLLTPSLENTSFSDSKVRGGTKSKHKDKSPSNLSPSPSSTTSSSSRSFLSKFFSLTHVISRTFSVEKIDKHRQTNIQGKGTLIKSAVSTPALSSARPFNDLNGNNQVTNQFNSTRTLIESGCTINNQENVEPVSLPIQSSGSKSLQTKSSSSSSFVRAFKNRLSLRRSKRKVKVKVDVTRTKSDPRGSKVNRYEDDKMLPKQSMKEETVFGSIVSTPGDYMKIVEIHRPQGKPFGFFVARGTVNNIKGIFISRIDSNGEKVYQGLLEIGDRLIEIDGIDVTEASVIQVNQLMSNKTKLTLKIVPFTALNNKP